MKHFLMAVMAAAMMCLAGCGGGSDSPSAAVKNFFTAVADKNETEIAKLRRKSPNTAPPTSPGCSSQCMTRFPKRTSPR